MGSTPPDPPRRRRLESPLLITAIHHSDTSHYYFVLVNSPKIFTAWVSEMIIVSEFPIILFIVTVNEEIDAKKVFAFKNTTYAFVERKPGKK